MIKLNLLSVVMKLWICDFTMSLYSILKNILKQNVVEKTENSSVKSVCIFEVKSV